MNSKKAGTVLTSPILNTFRPKQLAAYAIGIHSHWFSTCMSLELVKRKEKVSISFLLVKILFDLHRKSINWFETSNCYGNVCCFNSFVRFFFQFFNQTIGVFPNKIMMTLLSFLRRLIR